MSRNVRNFWIEAKADGLKDVAIGPRSKQGGIELTILMREEGRVSTASVKITGFVEKDLETGKARLVLSCRPHDKDGEIPMKGFRIETVRDKP